jgi:hypothetical protein
VPKALGRRNRRNEIVFAAKRVEGTGQRSTISATLIQNVHRRRSHSAEQVNHHRFAVGRFLSGKCIHQRAGE